MPQDITFEEKRDKWEKKDDGEWVKLQAGEWDYDKNQWKTEMRIDDPSKLDKRIRQIPDHANWHQIRTKGDHPKMREAYDRATGETKQVPTLLSSG